MATHRLSLPVLQNWSCHNCGGCCRQHVIELTEAEHRRIVEQQQWGPEDGIPEQQPLVEPHSGRGAATIYRLAHQPDGACVFLREDGLCRIHAKYGEAAKPLPCRIYPYVFHPAGKEVAVSLRFSCPSVVENRGQAVAEQQSELKRLAKLVVPDGIRKDPPPEIIPGERLSWNDTLHLVQQLDQAFSGPEPLAEQLQTALGWVGILGQATFREIQGPRLRELLELIIPAARLEQQQGDGASEPSGLSKLLFRILVAEYARRDTVADLKRGWAHRWWLFRSGLRFARGGGQTPGLQPDLPPVDFARIEQPHSWPAESEEVLRRMLRVKITGLHFCGRGYYKVPLVEGFNSLVLEVAAISWIARWLTLAATAESESIDAAADAPVPMQLDAVLRAVAIADHHHGFSERLGQPAARMRIRLLSRWNQISALLSRYGPRR